MSNYSKEEIKEFKAKDLRISKLAIVKSLIEKSEDIYDVQKITELAENYIDYIYEERRDNTEYRDATKRGQVGCVADSTEHKLNWEQLAIGLNLAIPNATNIKILNQVSDEYNKAHKASANSTVAGMSPADILVHILNTFGRYPAKTESVKKIVQSLVENLGD